jgi:hypothetical protein
MRRCLLKEAKICVAINRDSNLFSTSLCSTCRGFQHELDWQLLSLCRPPVLCLRSSKTETQ